MELNIKKLKSIKRINDFPAFSITSGHGDLTDVRMYIAVAETGDFSVSDVLFIVGYYEDEIFDDGYVLLSSYIITSSAKYTPVFELKQVKFDSKTIEYILDKLNNNEI